MPGVTVDVPEAHRGELLRELLNLYAVKADALHHTASAYLSERGKLDPVLADQSELTALHELIEQLGWRLDAPPQSARLTGDRYLLTEVARAMLESALRDLSERFDAAGPQPDEVAQAVGPGVRRVSSVLAFLQQAYRSAPGNRRAATR